MQYPRDASSDAKRVSPLQSGSEDKTAAICKDALVAAQRSVLPERSAEQLKEQNVEVLADLEIASSGTTSAEKEMPVPVSRLTQKKRCHRQLPFGDDQGDHEAAVSYRKLLFHLTLFIMPKYTTLFAYASCPMTEMQFGKGYFHLGSNGLSLYTIFLLLI